jgi:hypothetical protein
MTLYMTPEQMPTTVCTAHKYVELCKDSYGLYSDRLPASSKTSGYSVLDLRALILRLLLRMVPGRSISEEGRMVRV